MHALSVSLLVSVCPSVILGVCLSSLVLLSLVFLCFWWTNTTFYPFVQLCYVIMYSYLVTDSYLCYAVLWYIMLRIIACPMMFDIYCMGSVLSLM